ncbi:MAG: hypothetical protein PHX51_01340 [Clostridia bacterium]|nr:hypothetical protein [Clostridia bacterium]
MRVKRLLPLIVIVLIIVLAVVLFFGVFVLRGVEDFYKNENDELIDNSDSDSYVSAYVLLENYFGKPLVMIRDQSVIDEIERNYPRLRVIDVVQTFPTSIRLYLAERAPMYYMEFDGRALIIDRSLRIIDVYSLEQVTGGIIGIVGVDTIELSVAQAGYDLTFVSTSEYKFEILSEFSKCLESLRTNGEYADFVETVGLDSDEALQDRKLLCIKTLTGSEIIIEAPESELSQKLQYAYATYNATDTNNKVNRIIRVNSSLNVTTTDMGE